MLYSSVGNVPWHVSECRWFQCTQVNLFVFQPQLIYLLLFYQKRAHLVTKHFSVVFLAAFNAQKAFAYGRGIQNKGLRVREECVFYINTKEAGEAALKVQIIGPGELSAVQGRLYIAKCGITMRAVLSNDKDV